MQNFLDRSFIFVWLPLLTNSILAIAAFLINPEDFRQNVGLCYLAISFALIGSVVCFLGFKIHDVGPRRMLFALVAQSATMIVTFAGVYRGYGLWFAGGERLINDGVDALYFSIVTWTTLGYGDFTPPPELRLIAASQALLGYAFFGISVGLGTAILCDRKP